MSAAYRREVEEAIIVALHHIDHGNVEAARTELLACLPLPSQVEYIDARLDELSHFRPQLNDPLVIEDGSDV